MHNERNTQKKIVNRHTNTGAIVPQLPTVFDVSPFGVVVYKAIFVILRKSTYDFTLIVCNEWERGFDVWSNCGIGRKIPVKIVASPRNRLDAISGDCVCFLKIALLLSQ